MATKDQTVRAAELATRRSLYDQGLTDMEIARRTGAKRNTITVWRRSRGLPTRIGPRTHVRLTPGQRAARMLLYQLGWGDRHIAREQGVDKSSVREWRHRHGLAPNFPMGRNERWSPKPGMDSIVRKIRSAVGHHLPKDIAEDAVSDMTVAVLDGSIEIDSIEKDARRFGNRVLGHFANKFGPRSLDEAIPGTDDFLGIDMIADERSVSWLEEMGATWY